MTTINCDMGEGFGLYRMGDDEALMPLITVANVACGFHASDFNHMRRTVQLAKQHKVKVGAHPSLPDLQGFGRREMKISREELANCLIYQVGALCGFLRRRRNGAEPYQAARLALRHGRAHGGHCRCGLRCADIFRVPLFGMVGTLHGSVYPARGHRFVAEYYADLDYTDAGGLIITREHPPVDTARAAARCVRAIQEGVATSVNGVDVRVGSDSICIHSDTPNAVELAHAVRAAIAPWLRES